jgi:hypothetical protein
VSAALIAAKSAADAAMTAAEKAVSAALIAAREAVGKAEVSQQRTNEGQNEFRGQLKDQAATFMTRTEWDLSHRALIEKLDIANAAVGDLRSRLDVGPPSLSVLQTRSDQETGRANRSAELWTRVVSVGALLIAFAGFVAAFVFKV